MSDCPECNAERRTEPMTRTDGSQIGTLTIDVCDRCDAEADVNFGQFLDRIREGEFDDDSAAVQ